MKNIEKKMERIKVEGKVIEERLEELEEGIKRTVKMEKRKENTRKKG